MFSNVFEAAKSVSIREVINKFSNVNVGTSRYGGNIPCPLGRHKDSNPSFHIYDSTNSFHCFSCGCSGSTIDYVKFSTGLVDNVDAAKEICREFGIQYEDNYVKDPEYDNYTQVYNWVAGFFVRCNKYDNALNYWKSRGLDSLIDKYGLGYCPAVFRDKTNTVVTFKYILTQKFPHIPVATLDSYNLYDAYGQCVFSERYMFAIKNSKGDVVAFSGRTATNDPAKYKNSKETKYFQKRKILYNLDKAKGYPSVYIVEGQADALSLVAAGVPNVVASLGTAFTTEHLELLKGKDIILAFDNDDAGHTQMYKLLFENPTVNLYVQDIFDGKFKDFNEALMSGFDLKFYITRYPKRLGADYLLKLFTVNNKVLANLKDIKNKSFEQEIEDSNKYFELHNKDIYLDFSLLEDRVKLHQIISKVVKDYYPVEKDFFAVRLQRLIKGKRSKK
jgi:DNA primase